MSDISDYLQIEAYKLHIKEAATADLLEEYGKYYALRKYHLFDTEIELIKSEIIERCERSADPAEAKTETTAEVALRDWEITVRKL